MASYCIRVKNSIIKYPLRYILLISSFTFILSIISYKYAPPVTYKFTYDTLTIIYKPLLFLEELIPSQADPLLQDIIKNINTYIKYSIPLILAFFYFAYKEQKSISSKLLKGLPAVIFCTSVICTLVLGFLLLTSYKMFFNSTTTEFSRVYFYPLLVWQSSAIIAIVSLIIMINIFLKSLNINYLLKKKRSLIGKKLTHQYYTKSKIGQEVVYDDINSYMEAVFHSFEYSLNNKLEKTFEKENKNWNDLLFWLMEGTPSRWAVNIVSKELYTKNPYLFDPFYKSILRNQGNLIFKLVEANKFLETEDAINALSSLEPRKVIELYPTYFTILEEIYLKSLSIKDFPIEKLLEMLKDMTVFYDSSNEEVEEMSLTGIILIYRTLLKKTVEDDNVRLVNILSYSISNLINRNEDVTDQTEFDAKIYEYKITLNFLGSLNQNIKNDLQGSKPDNIILFVLFQASLKAIELGHYGCSGQLIKRITTDFSGRSIREKFRKFVKLNGDIREIIMNKPLAPLSIDFNFNEKSLSYCMQKLGLLIYSQERYILHKKITFTNFYKNDAIFIDYSYMDKSYIGYTLEKIKAIGDKYGLLFLNKDEDFFDKYIISEFQQSKKTKKSHQKIKKDKNR